MSEVLIRSEKMSEAFNIVKKSCENAKAYKKLYHCTSSEALLNIVKNKEFWLSNLKCVNDDMEYEMIDDIQYKNKYYIACFTTNANIDNAHWKKYGNNNGVLFSVEQSWFKREAVFLDICNNKIKNDVLKIFSDLNKACNYKTQQLQMFLRETYPFFVEDFNFYSVIYDDSLIPNIKGECEMILNNTSISGIQKVPQVGGIVKKCQGINNRDGSKGNWKDENEIRLKVCIRQIRTDDIRCIEDIVHAEKIAVSLNENAFKKFEIKFSPEFIGKENFLNELSTIIPDCSVTIIS